METRFGLYGGAQVIVVNESRAYDVRDLDTPTGLSRQEMRRAAISAFLANKPSYISDAFASTIEG